VYFICLGQYIIVIAPKQFLSLFCLSRLSKPLLPSHIVLAQNTTDSHVTRVLFRQNHWQHTIRTGILKAAPPNNISDLCCMMQCKLEPMQGTSTHSDRNPNCTRPPYVCQAHACGMPLWQHIMHHEGTLPSSLRSDPNHLVWYIAAHVLLDLSTTCLNIEDTV
jgi:hypothetical protein